MACRERSPSMSWALLRLALSFYDATSCAGQKWKKKNSNRSTSAALEWFKKAPCFPVPVQWLPFCQHSVLRPVNTCWHKVPKSREGIYQLIESSTLLDPVLQASWFCYDYIYMLYVVCLQYKKYMLFVTPTIPKQSVQPSESLAINSVNKRIATVLYSLDLSTTISWCKFDKNSSLRKSVSGVLSSLTWAGLPSKDPTRLGCSAMIAEGSWKICVYIYVFIYSNIYNYIYTYWYASLLHSIL